MPGRKLKTNEDLMQDLMQFSPRGALCQIFIIQAVQKYVDAIIKAGPNCLGEDSMVNSEAWHAVAVDIKQRMDAFYGRHDAS